MHGTAEFYTARAIVTLELLRSGRFHAVCVEADFPDADRVNRYVRGSSDPSIRDERDALSGFQARFPKFQWRNEQVDLVRGMRDMNSQRPHCSQRAWFCGMDVYALSRAADAVVSLLEKSGEHEAAQRARQRYACFDRFCDYAKGVARGDPGCEGAAVSQLVDMLRREAARTMEAAARGAAAAAAAVSFGGDAEGEAGISAAATESEDALAALCNARSVVHAEAYYRQMVLGRRNTWNLRDTAMVETVLLLKAHLEGGVFDVSDEEEKGGGRGAAAPASTSASLSSAPSSSLSQKTKRVIVWAHNSHLGDARATAMSRRCEHNVGQLLRQHFENLGRRGAVLNLGFSTYTGTVCAAARWGGPALCRGVRPGMRGSYEEVLHRVARLLQSGCDSGGKEEEEEKEQQQQQLSAVAAAISASSPGAFLLDLRHSSSPSFSSPSSANSAMIDALSTPRLERAIGVLYVPRSERYSHYFAAKLPQQFDLLVHVDETSAVSPLDFQESAAPTLERWRERVIGPDDPFKSEE